MKVFMNGKNIQGNSDLHVQNAIYEQYAECYNDTLTLTMIDPEGLWSPDALEDTTVQIIEGDLDTGIMYLHKVIVENNFFTIIARSMPKEPRARTKEWVQVRLSEIGSEVAAGLGLRYESYDIIDHFYGLLRQKGKTDLEFLSDLCHLEGYGMTIWNGKLVIYDEKSIESMDGEPVRIGDEGVYRFTVRPGIEYRSCKVEGVKCDKYCHTHCRDCDLKKEDLCPIKNCPCMTEPEYSGTFGSGDGMSVEMEVESDGQALRYARGILRNHNKKTWTGWYAKPLSGAFQAGAVIDLTVSKSKLLNGKYFIEKIKHDIANQRTVFHVRRCLSF